MYHPFCLVLISNIYKHSPVDKNILYFIVYPHFYFVLFLNIYKHSPVDKNQLSITKL